MKWLENTTTISPTQKVTGSTKLQKIGKVIYKSTTIDFLRYSATKIQRMPPLVKKFMKNNLSTESHFDRKPRITTVISIVNSTVDEKDSKEGLKNHIISNYSLPKYHAFSNLATTNFPQPVSTNLTTQFLISTAARKQNSTRLRSYTTDQTTGLMN